MSKVLLFAGTSEGRLLAESICENIDLHCCVATEYGKELLPEIKENLTIHQGRLTIDDMVALMKREKFDMVIDTTHPYAKIVTENIIEACNRTHIKYIRYLRKSEDIKNMDKVKVYANIEETVRYLNSIEGNILLTVGSKELSKFTDVKEFENRVFARVLPMTNVVDECIKMGFKGRNLICMQGPFFHSLNVALIEQTDAKVMVTKDTGKIGGFKEKLEAASDAGIELIVISRPTVEKGYELSEIADLLNNEFGRFSCDKEKLLIVDRYNVENIEKVEDAFNFEHFFDRNSYSDIKDKANFFPLFVNSNRKALFIGGGKIATKRIKTMINFDFDIVVVAPEIDKELTSLYENGIISWKEKFLKLDEIDKQIYDLEKGDIIFAATCDKEFNIEICNRVNSLRGNEIYYNCISSKEHCNFYFPGIAIKDEIVVGVTAQGKNHKKAKLFTDKIKNM